MDTKTAPKPQRTAVADATVATPGTQLEQQFSDYLPQIEMVLPAHMQVEKFKRVFFTAVNKNPDLVNADRRSLFNACVSAAQDGLYPDGREAALVMFSKQAQYMPMIAGVRKRMRNSGEVKSAEAHVIYAGDEFSWEMGDDPRIVHRPPEIGKARGEPVGAYAIIKLANGEVLREVMSLEEIERVRAVSKVKFGPWKDWWSEMARKTVLRRCAKAAPTSSDVDAVLARDDTLGIEGEYSEVPPPRPVRTALVAPVDMAAAGHADLDAGYRRTMSGTIPDDDADQADQADQAGSSAYDQQVRRRLCIETNRAAVDKWLEKNAAHLAAYRDIDPKNAEVLDEWIAALPISPGSHVDQAGRELTEIDAG